MRECKRTALWKALEAYRDDHSAIAYDESAQEVAGCNCKLCNQSAAALCPPPDQIDNLEENLAAAGALRKMSDDEIICTFMEARPVDKPDRTRVDWHMSKGGWWQFRYSFTCQNYRVQPIDLTLDALHEVEGHLTPDQRIEYCMALRKSPFAERRKWNWEMINADAPARIKALASILRPIVENTGRREMQIGESLK